MRGLLPYFFCVALGVWLIGGTVWYKKHYCQDSLDTAETTIAPWAKEQQTVKLATPFSFANSDSRLVYSEKGFPKTNAVDIKGLNLYFKKNKFLFALTPELHEYFNDLKQYLKINPNAIIKISSYIDSTEGGKISKKRLSNFYLFLIENNFPKRQILHEIGGISRQNESINSLKNQRIEVRFVIP